MKEVYLSSMYIENFRTFGEFSVEVPAAPGLLLLTGTNGLGKSSFFDAIEWALTGKIRRFTPYVSHQGKTVIPEKDYLTRYGAEPDSHAVTLLFSEGESIRRSASEAPSPAMVAELLARPGRGEITDLGTHLAMTHFLGQAERQRFTSREADDQWAALKGPSGVDRLEVIRTRLRGRTTTYAFNSRVKADQALIAEIEREIANWQGWRARLERLQTAVRAGGGLTEEDVRSRSAWIQAEIARIAGLKPTDVAGEATGQLLARLATLLATTSKQADERVVRLTGAPALIERYESETGLDNKEHPNLVRARQQLDIAGKVCAEAQAKVTASNDAVTAQSEVVASAGAEIGRLEGARTDLIHQGELKPIIEAARAELAAKNAALEEQRRLLNEAEGIVFTHAAVAAEVSRLQGVATQTSADLEASSRLADLTAYASARQADLDESVSAAAAVKGEHDDAIRRRDQLSTSLEAEKGELAEAERHASAIAVAVASISSHIHDDDESCPVCQAIYPAGELKLLAAEAARSGNARVTEISKRAEDLAGQIAAVKQRIGELAPLLARPASLQLDVSRARQAAAEQATALLQSLDGGESDDLSSLAASRDSASQMQLADALARLAALQPVALAAEQRRTATAAEIDQLASRVDAATARLNGLLAEERDLAERIAARGIPTPTIGEIGQLLATRRIELETARKQLGELEGESAAAHAALKPLEEQLRARETELAAAELVQKNAVQVTQELIKQWTALGLTGTPNRAALEAAQGTANKASTDLALLYNNLRELSEVNQDLLLDEEVAIVIAQMRAAGGDAGVDDPDAYLKTLQVKLPSARAALKLSQDAQDAINKYTVKLGERAEAYNREVLQPLNERILEFNAAMLSTPGASVQFKANKRIDRTDFEMQLEYGDQIENSLLSDRKVPPQVVLSEGQLAANGFSILCAASTAYRWSRWRALLLDDPLQHNDIIHTAAFVDVMRNLVELEGYQLVMSSHDRAESDFIARKFDAAGLACTTVLLTAPSESGVVYDPPSFNVPARRIISARTGTATATSA
ncbi:AAA family ATPase [Mesorhizobium sp. M0013]|uniref:AAA family ATPase n=1 Tax=Mesorhizobium sp. M0013 TaxID=2956841 RepID=UPI003337C97C